MGYIMNKLISHVSVLENIDFDALMKEAREAYLLTASIKLSVDNAMAQATSEAAKVGYIYVYMTYLVTPG